MISSDVPSMLYTYTDIMNILQAVILSIVEGVTEFLPISSTGHLILASKLLAITQSEFVKSFEIAIQLGAIAAVAWMYKTEIVTNRKMWPKIILAFIPTAIIGLVFFKIIKTNLIGNVGITLAALAVGGVFLIFLEKIPLFNSQTKKKSIADLSNKQSVIIGIAQSLSVIPGVSRAAATIVGGLGVGLTREEAVKFSFLLAIPTMAAATGLDIIKTGWHFTTNEFLILGVGFAGAFITALLTVRWLVKYVRKHNFFGFGVYRLVLAGVFWWWMSK